MSNQSHFEINVSLNGRHFFATAPRSCVNPSETKAVRDVLRKKFPESEGFAVEVTYWKCEGYRASLD